jgi:hypothetical protein
MARPTQQEIDEFNARMEEPEDNIDDFEIEIFSPEGHGARLPYSRGRAYLQQHFGIDLDESPTQTEPPANQPKGKKQNPADPNSPESENGDPVTPLRTSQRYFGKRPA